MVEVYRIKRLKPNEELRQNTYFRLVAAHNKPYGPYFVSGEPFAVKEKNECLVRGVEIAVQNCRLTPTMHDTVILPGVKIAVYNTPKDDRRIFKTHIKRGQRRTG